MPQTKRDMLSALRAISFEVLLIGLVLLLIFGVLNYFNIFSISTAVPFLSFLPRINQTVSFPANSPNSNGGNYPKITTSQTQSDLKSKNTKTSATVIEEVQILEVSVVGGTLQTKKGLEKYEMKLKVRGDKGIKTFYYEKKDIPNITVFEKVNGKDQSINFSDLKIGDKILMNVSYNPVTSELLKLIITRI